MRLPRSDETERAVLACIFLKHELLESATDRLRPGDFYSDRNWVIYEAMLELNKAGLAIDIRTVEASLEKIGKLGAIGGLAYLADLDASLPDFGAFQSYVQLLGDLSKRRQTLELLQEAQPKIASGEVELATVVADLQKLSTVEATAQIKFVSAADLSSHMKRDGHWIVYGIAKPGAITELAGKIKASGKTTYSTYMAACVLDGIPFHGLRTERCPVVYLTEQPPSSFYEAASRAGILGREDLSLLFFQDVIGKELRSIVRAAVEECKRIGAGLLIVDTLSQFAGLRGESENSAGDALAAMQPLQEAAATGLAVHYSRHERKSGGDVGEAARGSSAFAGVADILLSLRPMGGNHRPTLRELRSLSRFEETPNRLVIELTPDGYVSLGDPATVAADEAQKSIVESLPASEDFALTYDQLAEETGVKKTTLRETVNRLIEDGGVLKTGAGKRGDPYRYFLPQTEQPSVPEEVLL